LIFLYPYGTVASVCLFSKGTRGILMGHTILAIFAMFIIRLVGFLLRYRFYNRHHSILAEEEGKAVLYAFWHGKQLMLLNYPLPMPMVQMVSLSKDGDLQNEILKLLGFSIVRGSSGKRGQEALYEMTDMILKGCHGALAVDGSRGPYGKVKDGILHLARDTGGVVIPLAAATQRKIVLKKSWDKYEIPLPFSKTVVLEGKPLEINPDISDDELEGQRKILERALRNLHQKAEELLNNPNALNEKDADEQTV